MLRRLGRKKLLLPKLLSMFPKNINFFIDLFMGSGCVSFAMLDRAEHVLANDIDDDVFNLFQVFKEQPDELLERVKLTPYSESIFQNWKVTEEVDPIWKAVRFLYLSNYGFMGKTSICRFQASNAKEILVKDITELFHTIGNIQFQHQDFRDCLDRVQIKEPKFTFIYADPPYLGTRNNYQQGFTLKDTTDLFDILVSSDCRFAMSEFDNPQVLELAAKHDLIVSDVVERRSLKNRATEILITNYQPNGQIQLL